ncbi:sensor histidine kinase [Gracilibacillus sp. YIM 98692]|uniref:sensor histidine kinase n=1 Tax=Gracilibacillus sp. YIM 98692 TaxID=2663532 RepID=UPI0013D44002|nr:sensor histidine kinase [Gracilibacillus sp. YIM 98692]
MKRLHVKKRLTIKTQIVLLALFSTLVPLVVIGTFTFYYQNKIIENKVSNTADNFLKMVDRNVASLIKDVENMSNIIFLSNEIQNYLSHQQTSPRLYQLENSSRKLLNNITVVNKPYINGIYIGNEDNEFLKVNSGYAIHKDNNHEIIQKATWYTKLKKSEWGGVWFDANQTKLIENYSNKTDTLMFGRVIRDLSSSEELGLSLISLDKSFFDNMLSSIDLDGTIVIYNGNTPIYFSDKNKIKQENLSEIFEYSQEKTTQIKSVNGTKYFINSYNNDEIQWTMVSLIPYNSFIKEFIQIRLITIALLFLSFLLVVIFAFLISRKITKHLSLLRKVSKNMEKDTLITPLDFDTNDEIGEIGNRLVEVYNKNKELTMRLYTSQLKEKEAELRALHNHIKPHFLYNTLNLIYWMAEKEKMRPIAKMAISLSKLFKLTLNNGNYMTSVKNEIEQIKHYLFIQNIRFNNKIDYQINIDPEILEERIIKLLLQPLVENAVYHGLEPKEGQGCIIINGKYYEKGIMFEIMDDGVGFDQHNSFGYGLQNIKERIELYYGDKYGLSMESQVNKGTKATILIAKAKHQIS